ncbi:hypothetical protein M145_2987 [Bacteroides fragilis str. 34-F-2 |nr:hypothetical protein M145_2987 [Bacteroides fragilis str. 34-F-2 \
MPEVFINLRHTSNILLFPSFLNRYLIKKIVPAGKKATDLLRQRRFYQ